MEKAFEELQIKDDFMFSVIMRNPKFCKPFLERILGIKISRIEYPKSQETIDIAVDAKSVRLDIYVEDRKETVYNIDYSDFQVIPINLFWILYFRYFKQVYRNKFLVAPY